MNDANLTKYQFAYAPDLIPRLGIRVAQEDTWNNIDTLDAAYYYAKFAMNVANANCRNCGLQVIPRFGLMVNRPVYWKFRNQHANIISLDHSMVWQSEVMTQLSLNNIRAWNGMYDRESKPEFVKFAGKQFNFLELLKKTLSVNVNRKNIDKNQEPMYDSDFNETVNPDSIF